MIKLSPGDNQIVGGVNVRNFPNPVSQNNRGIKRTFVMSKKRSGIQNFNVKPFLRVGLNAQTKFKSKSIGF